MSWLCKGKLRLSPQDQCGFYLLAVFNVSALSDYFFGSRWVSDAPAETPPRSGVRTRGRRLAASPSSRQSGLLVRSVLPEGWHALPGRGRAGKTSQKSQLNLKTDTKKPQSKTSEMYFGVSLFQGLQGQTGLNLWTPQSILLLKTILWRPNRFRRLSCIFLISSTCIFFFYYCLSLSSAKLLLCFSCLLSLCCLCCCKCKFHTTVGRIKCYLQEEETWEKKRSRQ